MNQRDGEIPISPLYYDEQGVVINDDAAAENMFRRKYRVEVRLVTPSNANKPENTSGLKTLVVKIGWPVDPNTGEVLGERDPITSTFHVTTLTGTDWPQLDSQYKPKIEY